VKPVTFLKSGGRILKLTNLEKVLYPECGFTKGDVIRYYQAVAPVVLPHLRDRPFTLRRFPDGVDAPAFFEKNCPSHRPDWIKTGWFRDVHHCLIQDAPSLIWAANLAAIELHTTLGKISRPDFADFMVFDLDPGEGVGLAECAETALLIREELQARGLESWAKVSGGKGVHVYVPLNSNVRFSESKVFLRELAAIIESAHPDRVLTSMKKSLRRGKVFIDWSQNTDFKTTTTVYSLRAQARPWISMPVEWREVKRAAGAAASRAEQILRFDPGAALSRIEAKGDLFAPVLKFRQKLPSTT
jgi:bifunctional non-homologous end joining protein LigD